MCDLIFPNAFHYRAGLFSVCQCVKLTAKLRDTVLVCIPVEGKDIKRYKSIEIPDDIKKLEYLDFEFNVPLNGAITFKIMFELAVLLDEFPQALERKARKSIAQEEQTQEAALT
jgi:hypothetical protein